MDYEHEHHYHGPHFIEVMAQPAAPSVAPDHDDEVWEAMGEPPALAGLDVERLGFRDLLDVADAILTKYPPDTIVCSHLHRADVGARTVAAIADLIESARHAE
jgi:hypothetical protein